MDDGYLGEADVEDLGPEGARGPVDVCEDGRAARGWVGADVEEFPECKGLMVVSKCIRIWYWAGILWGFLSSTSVQ